MVMILFDKIIINPLGTNTFHMSTSSLHTKSTATMHVLHSSSHHCWVIAQNVDLVGDTIL